MYIVEFPGFIVSEIYSYSLLKQFRQSIRDKISNHNFTVIKNPEARIVNMVTKEFIIIHNVLEVDLHWIAYRLKFTTGKKSAVVLHIVKEYIAHVPHYAPDMLSKVFRRVRFDHRYHHSDILRESLFTLWKNIGFKSHITGY